MGAVIMFPQAQRESHKMPPADVPAAIIILPAIRIERACNARSEPEIETPKLPPGRKRRGPAARS
jgi:hypothetical protein